ncbi:hypothetical protein F441_03501 [Phytophthora nicotianae CJ01A1]|uniref:Uncharacterized protein n=5 Tax=Phytophthora nicotianae TaxID=4792 RepID=V9FQ00_PHYNI|nr:hypothetical protein F443_03489 [Phytophthora nicotianae P1569]ETK93439.1 hypothetical protein L915_03376 [Phytophthora nicotianae]ETO82247.1 hypothetical protein F444_03576 [Phytophthora nicotianae P1976]ETP23363.1 hypothetical protein F441_03501 [Phytophthora nicotianae CJ01A1]ETP51371.1 hypothetical protein F442_03470 [Phytophthora nicotianae P10297]
MTSTLDQLAIVCGQPVLVSYSTKRAILKFQAIENYVYEAEIQVTRVAWTTTT